MKQTTKHRLRLVEEVEPARRGPSDRFLRLTRNPDITPPTKVVRTPKREGEIVI